MKKVLVLIFSLIIGMVVFCSCGNTPTVTEQTAKLRYEVPEGWTAKTVTPAPSTLKIYKYDDCTIRIESLSYRFYENSLQEALDYAAGEALAKSDSSMEYESELASEGTVADMPAKEAVIQSITIDDNERISGIFTAMESETGTYVISTIAETEELGEQVRKLHRKVIDTVEYVDTLDPEVYNKIIFQFSDYVCGVPKWDTHVMDFPWWDSRTEYSNGIINYVSDRDISNVVIVPMDETDLTDTVIVETLEQIYNGKLGADADCSIINRKLVEAATGSGLHVEVGLSFGDEGSNTSKTSALFVMDKEGKAVACFSNPSDYDVSYDYTGITNSIQPAEPVYATINSLCDKATEYVGDNSAVMGIANDLGFGVYGDYTIELQTEKEPYGVTVKYKGDVKDYDFKRESIIMIGLIGNLDYVDIKDSNSDIVHYDYELVKGLMRSDVKKMATEKAKIENFYLDMLYR